MDGQRLVHTLLQTVSCARIQIHQVAVQQIQRPPGVGVFAHVVGTIQSLTDVPVMFFR